MEVPNDNARMADTPITPDAIRQYDNLDPLEAVVRAWTDPGPHRNWHAGAAGDVRETMPLLGRGLDRLAAEYAEWRDLRWRTLEP